MFNASHATPWNKGRIVGQKAPLKLREIWAIRVRLQLWKEYRSLAMFNLAIDSKLRASDLVALRVGDVLQGGQVLPRAIVKQIKTHRSVAFELMIHTRQSVIQWITFASLAYGDYLFPGRKPGTHMTTRQYSRIVKEWVASIGLPESAYGTHTMRRTKPSLIYRRTKNLRAIQLLLGHAKLESTVRYLGVEVDDALDIAEQTDA